jgi:hypothetical protein
MVTQTMDPLVLSISGTLGVSRSQVSEDFLSEFCSDVSSMSLFVNKYRSGEGKYSLW